MDYGKKALSKIQQLVPENLQNVSNAITQLNSDLTVKATKTEVATERARIDLINTSAGNYYIKCLSTDSGSLLVVASGATTGQINLASVTPRLNTYTPVAGDYVRLVSNGLTTELIDMRIGADGITDTSAGTGTRRQFTNLKSTLNDLENSLYRVNLFDPAQTVDGSYYRTTLNQALYTVASATNTVCTTRFSCKKGDIIYTNFSYSRICIVNSANSVIESYNDAPLEHTVTSDNAVAVYVSVAVANKNLFMLSINNKLPIEYMTYNEKKAKGIREISENLSKIDTISNDIGITHRNIFNKNDISNLSGYSYNINAGEIFKNASTTTNTSNQRWRVSKGDIIYTNQYYFSIFIVDSSEKLVEYFNSNSYEFEVTSDNAYEMLIQFSASYTDTLMMSINLPLPSDYIGYDESKDIMTLNAKKAEKYIGNSYGKSAILLTFDDVVDGFLQDARYALVKGTYGYNFSVGVGAGDETHNGMLKTLAKNGIDLCVYKYEDCPVDTYGGTSADSNDVNIQAEWDSYMTSAVTALAGAGIYNPVGWFCRLGLTGSNVEKYAKKNGIKLVRGNKYSTGSDCITDNDSMSLTNYGINSSSVGSVLSAIDRAISNGYDICINTHSFVAEGTQGEYACTQSQYTTMLNKVKEYVDAGKAEVLTFHQYYARRNPVDSVANDRERLYKMVF